MTGLAASQQLVHARRFRATYLVSRGHPSPEQLRSRLDDATGAALCEVFAAALTQHLDATDESVWFIRRIEIDLSVNADWDREQLVRVWARKLALELVQTLASGEDGVNVIRFANRTAYVIQFLADLVEERAWSRWYYESFAGLRLLPLSAAIRTLICQDPVVGVGALLALPSVILPRLLASLSTQDAWRILDAFPAGHTSADVQGCLDVVWRAYQQLGVGTSGDGEARGVLRLSLEAMRWEPERSGEALGLAVRAILRLAHIATANPSTLLAIRHALMLGSAALYTVVSPEDASVLAPLADATPTWLNNLVHTLRTVHLGASVTRVTNQFEIRSTPFGGAFLLLPIIASLPLDQATAGWPTCGEVAPLALARLLVLSKCLGGGSLPHLLLDTTMRDLLQIDPQLWIVGLTQWMRQIPRQQLQQMRPGDAVLTNPEPPQWLRQDLRYLAFPPSVSEPPFVRRTFGRLAMRVLRTFARRLPGFSQSSFTHLHTNFLTIAATVETHPERRVVQLSRPPLDIILNMTGMSRATYRLPWLDGRPFMLFPESAR